MRSVFNRPTQLVGLFAVVAVVSAACGGGGDKTSPTAAATAKPATTSTAASATPTATQAAGENGGSSSLTLIGKNNAFDKAELKATPGAVTINFDNQDAGIPHNLRVYKGKDNTGQDVGKTEIEAGPNQQTLTLNLTPGEYFYVCEVHPGTMTGKLEVE